MPSDARGTPIKLSYDYYGVLMAYGGLQDFLKERNSGYTITLVRTRVLPLYSLHRCLPHLIAAANWVIGELASCFPQEISADIYRSLMKALTMSDEGACSYYPVRASAAGAIAELLENDYVPPDWLSLLDVLINRMSSGDENESSLLFQLLKTVLEVGEQNVAVHIPLIVSNVTSIILKHLPPIPEPWPQVVECGFTALAVIAQTWEDSMPDEIKQSESNREGRSVWAAIARSFSSVLQQAWLTSIQQMGEEFSGALPPPSCIEDASALLGFIMRFIKEKDEATELKITELLLVWADLIADWHSWEEMEDLKIFSSIEEAVHLHKKFDSENLSMRRIPSKYFPTSTQHSIIEGIGAFVTEAISAYPSATWRACSSTHLLLHVPRFSFESENIKQSLAIAFTQAAFSRFRDIQNNPIALWKPLLLVISSCYLCYPEDTERVLQNDEEGGFTVWACGLACISGSSFEPALSSESEIKLAVMTLAKLVERLLQSPSDIGTGVLRDCFVSLMEASIHLKEVQVEEEDGEDDDDDDDDEEEEEDEEEETTDEESEYDEHEETEEDFLDRYAKAANALESELVVEGDVEDEVQELDLGEMDRIDAQRVVFSLIGRHEQVLVQGQLLPSQLVEGILGAFPEYGLYFQASY